MEGRARCSINGRGYQADVAVLLLKKTCHSERPEGTRTDRLRNRTIF